MRRPYSLEAALILLVAAKVGVGLEALLVVIAYALLWG